MSLRDADIQATYFLSGASPYFFYNELYLHSTEIYIALGYFAKTAFCLGTDGLLTFIKNGGKIHILCNRKILPEDVQAISQGYAYKEESAITIKDFEKLISDRSLHDIQKFSYKCLSYLIGIGRLDVNIAKSDRLVHFKIGYAKDDEGNIVAFSGSVNYTMSGLLFNWEQLLTYKSWEHPEVFEPRIKEIVNPINELFSGHISGLPLIDGKQIETYITENYPVQDLSDLEEDAKRARHKVKINLFRKQIKLIEDTEDEPFLEVPSNYQPRPHQKDAISNFLENDCVSLFAMATGTGKTLTSLFAANDLCFEKDIQSILILVPLSDLVNQWTKDVRKMYNGLLIQIGSKFPEWRTLLQDYNISRRINSRERVVIIATYDSYVQNCKKILSSLNQENTLLIADEVHTFGAKNRQQALPEMIKYRIGLSATPKRAYDEKGTKAVFDYFCPSENPYIFGIDEAIKAGFLCKYNYYPLIVHLTDEEYDEYQQLSDKISRLSFMTSEDDEDKEELTRLCKKRHRIVENASNKLDTVIEYFDEYIDSTDFSRTIVFCPEGKNEEDDENIDLIQSAIWSVFRNHKKRIKMAKYIQGTSEEVLKGFSNGTIDMLLAKKRLNEGIDIPSTMRAIFVSSSTSEREFIQRRGRVLRLYEGKEIADIIDLIVVPPINAIESVFQNEIVRFLDFAKTAENSTDALMVINSYMEVQGAK